MEKTIAVRLFTWFQNVKSPINSDEMQRVERIAHLGETVDIDDDASLRRGEELGAFFSDEDAEAIANGTFRGPTAELIYARRVGTRPAQLNDEASQLPAGDFDVHEASTDELADYISENKLSVPATRSLIPENADLEMLEKFYDAENLATENEPRKGVTDYLDARMQALNG
jgi:hypothetical protein